MKPYLLYTTPSFASFVKKDIEIISENFEVTTFLFSPKKKIYTIFIFIKQLSGLLFSKKPDIYICQFAGYHSFLPAVIARLRHKHCIILPAGTDCVGFPKINYGNFRKLILGRFTCWSYRLCSEIVPLHKSLIKTQSNFDISQNQPQGFLSYCPDVKARIKVIHNGFSSSDWKCTDEKQENTFITVASGLNEKQRFILKGIDLIISASLSFPNAQFTIVGSKMPLFIKNLPPNIKWIDFSTREQLIKLLSKNRFYFQLSISEGFPNSVCEAMLCECIPITSPVTSLPEITGETGLTLQHRNLDEFISVIAKAMDLPDENGLKARQRIIDLFPLEKRRIELLQFLNELI